MQRLYNKGIPKVCENCYFGRLSPNEKSVLCRKNGVVMLSFSCRHFKYDPLKRRPKKLPGLSQYSKKDFEL